MGVEKQEKYNPSERMKMWEAKAQALDIFSRVCKIGKVDSKDKNSVTRYMPVVKEDGHRWKLSATKHSDGDFNIQIFWKWDKFSMYQLRYTKKTDSFSLNTFGGGKGIEKRENLSGDELLKNVLPNFEKRLNHAEQQKIQERKKSLNDASKLAYEEDNNDADRLFAENGLA